MIRLRINGVPRTVRPGDTVAAAVLAAGHAFLRHSVTGEPRSALCGMGICFECRLRVDGVAHVRSCQTLCREGMEVSTE